MQHFEINLDLPLHEQIASLRSAVDAAKQAKRHLRLVSYRGLSSWMYEKPPVISDSLIKALMVKFQIAQYVERNEETQDIISQPVKFTYDMVNNIKSHFFNRHANNIFLAAGLSASASVMGGWYLATMLLAAAFISVPVVFIIIGALTLLAMAVVGIASFILSKKEQTKVENEIKEANKILEPVLAAEKLKVENNIKMEIQRLKGQAVAVKMPTSAHVITQEFDAQLEAIPQRAMSQQVDTKPAGLEKAIENNQALGGEVKAVKATDTNEPNSALTESAYTHGYAEPALVSEALARSMAAALGLGGWTAAMSPEFGHTLEPDELKSTPVSKQ